jgi:D-aspartate ligase
MPEQAPPSALILGGAHGALALARSLARHGIAVDIVANHPLPLFSRHIRRRFSWHESRHGAGPDALPRLIDLARREGLAGAVLFAGGDSEVRFIAENHAALAPAFRLTTPPWSALQTLVDKRLMHRHAAALGLAVPLAVEPRERRELEAMPLRFPLVLKPTVRTAENAFTLAKAWRADDCTTLLARFDEAAGLVGAEQIVVQELIPGGGEAQYSYAAVFDRGRPVAELVARRRRQYPVEFGYTSTLVEIADCPPVEDAGRRLLASLDYTGIAEVEFKHDARDGGYKLLDVNARIWTWAGLGAAAGVDFPVALWRIARGEAVAPLRPTRDIAWLHASRDLVAAGHEMLRGRLTLAAWLRSLARPLTFAAFALDDPLPGLVELPLALGRTLTHRLPIVAAEFWHRIMRADPPPLTPAPGSRYSLWRLRRRRSSGRAD